jgi:HAD superfamily hydrolase (TIGR01509 family)
VLKIKKVIIFDLDGLLVDSQPIQYKAYNQVFTKYGFPLSILDWKNWVENSYSAKSWITKNQIPLAYEKVRSEKKEVYNELILSELELMPGAKSIVNELNNNFRLCIASASRLESIELILHKFNLRGKFETILSDKDLKRGKPHPDVFLKAAELMRVTPKECVVVEDSIAGLNAARAAGMKCVICPDKFTNTDIKQYEKADLIISSLENLSTVTILNL